MAEEFETKFIRPIINASYPGTLAALSLAALQASGGSIPLTLQFLLLLSAMMFLLSAFFIFFYSIYPTRKRLWTSTAISFLMGLLSSTLSVFFLFATLR